MDTLVSIENDDDVCDVMQAFPESSEVTQHFICSSLLTAVVTTRKPDDYGTLKATSSGIHTSNNVFLPLPNNATLCSTVVWIFYRQKSMTLNSDYQESVGEVADDIGRDNQTRKLIVEDISSCEQVDTKDKIFQGKSST